MAASPSRGSRAERDARRAPPYGPGGPPYVDGRIEALSARRRRHARAQRHARHRAVVLAGVLSLLVLAGAGLAVGMLFVDDPAALVNCDLGALHARTLGGTTFLTASNGARLGALPSTWNREPVRLGQISPWLPKATVAIEDARFWTRHGALDLEAITRAALADIRAGHTVQGGSTIAQQLVRDRYLRAPAPTLSRKLTEACLAAQFEQHYSRRTILQDYLNEVYYGQRAYGAQAAAETYFSRTARRLTLPQAALLAGLPQAPSVFDPLRHPGLARRRRNDVLTALRNTGQISAARYRAATRRSLQLNPSARYATARGQPFFEFARREILHRFGRWRAMHGGMDVATTLDPRLQSAARTAIHNWLGLPGEPAAAVVAIDPSSGAIRAMAVDAPGDQKSDFNLASQSRRQAGSTFKVFALTAAMEAGIPLSSVWHGPSSLTVTEPRCMNGIATPWVVHNFADEAHGTMSLLQATAFSVNTIFAQVVLKVGPQHVVDAARRMGVQSPLVPVCSITLGPEGVSPLDMTDAFATLAARGVHHAPDALQQVTGPNGTVLARIGTRGNQAIGRSVADRVTYALSGVIRAGTGTAANIGRPAAGKTGTAESFNDAWFCGFVPQLATCVWVGYPSAEIPLLNLDGFGEVVGGSIPARIWHDFMSTAVAGLPVEPLPTASAGSLRSSTVQPAATPALRR